MDVEHLEEVPGIYRSNTYSAAVVVGNLLFCSGITAREPDGKVHAPGDPTEQARYCFEKLRRVLEAAGCSLSDVVKVTTYVTRFEHRAPTDISRPPCLPAPASSSHPSPTRTCCSRSKRSRRSLSAPSQGSSAQEHS